MNIKKLVCFFALLALCCTYPFALVNEINGQDLDRQLNDNGGGVGGGSDERVHYKRHIFNLQFENGYTYSTEFSATGSGWKNGKTFECLRLSCCIHAWLWKTCDFKIDDTDCDKYIDRWRGEPYESSTHKM